MKALSKETPQPSFEEMIEAAAERVFDRKAAPLKQELAIANRILARIPMQMSTKEAMAATGIKTRHTLEKTFTPHQDGPKGRITYKVVDIERHIALRELAA